MCGGRGVYGNTLYLLFSIAVNLKLQSGRDTVKDYVPHNLELSQSARKLGCVPTNPLCLCILCIKWEIIDYIVLIL